MDIKPYLYIGTPDQPVQLRSLIWELDCLLFCKVELYWLSGQAGYVVHCIWYLTNITRIRQSLNKRYFQISSSSCFSFKIMLVVHKIKYVATWFLVLCAVGGIQARLSSFCRAKRSFWSQPLPKEETFISTITLMKSFTWFTMRQTKIIQFRHSKRKIKKIGENTKMNTS